MEHVTCRSGQRTFQQEQDLVEVPEHYHYIMLRYWSVVARGGHEPCRGPRALSPYHVTILGSVTHWVSLD